MQGDNNFQKLITQMKRARDKVQSIIIPSVTSDYRNSTIFKFISFGQDNPLPKQTPLSRTNDRINNTQLDPTERMEKSSPFPRVREKHEKKLTNPREIN